jgi:hypothetical protein
MSFHILSRRRKGQIHGGYFSNNVMNTQEDCLIRSHWVNQTESPESNDAVQLGSIIVCYRRPFITSSAVLRAIAMINSMLESLLIDELGV